MDLILLSLNWQQQSVHIALTLQHQQPLLLSESFEAMHPCLHYRCAYYGRSGAEKLITHVDCNVSRSISKESQIVTMCSNRSES